MQKPSFSEHDPVQLGREAWQAEQGLQHKDLKKRAEEWSSDEGFIKRFIAAYYEAAKGSAQFKYDSGRWKG